MNDEFIRTYVPMQPLSFYIEFFWYMESDQPAYSKELSLPDGTVELIIDLREEKVKLYDYNNDELTLSSVMLSGPHLQYFQIDTSTSTTVMGVHFKPGGATSVLGIPASEIFNSHLSMDLLWGTSAKLIREQLLETRSLECKFDLLECFLLEELAKQEHVVQHSAVPFALQQLQLGFGSTSIAEICDQAGISHKRFIEVFREQVGMSPKRYSRLIRFQQALNMIHPDDEVDWLEIAYQCGYFDQSHFIKEFQAFTGMKPSQYKPGRHQNHVALL